LDLGSLFPNLLIPSYKKFNCIFILRFFINKNPTNLIFVGFLSLGKDVVDFL